MGRAHCGNTGASWEGQGNPNCLNTTVPWVISYRYHWGGVTAVQDFCKSHSVFSGGDSKSKCFKFRMIASLCMWCLISVGRKFRHLEWAEAVLYLLQVLSLAEVSHKVSSKHGDLSSRLVHQKRDDLQTIAYWQELQMHLKLEKMAKYSSLKHEVYE